MDSGFPCVPDTKSLPHRRQIAFRRVVGLCSRCVHLRHCPYASGVRFSGLIQRVERFVHLSANPFSLIQRISGVGHGMYPILPAVERQKLHRFNRAVLWQKRRSLFPFERWTRLGI
jgi:hypothetical protein